MLSAGSATNFPSVTSPWRKLAAIGTLACAAASHGQAIPPDEELVLGLSRLARAGAVEVCNAALLEQVLGISIGPMREFLRIEPPLRWQSTERIAAAVGKPPIRRGRFDRRRSGEHGVCQLSLEYEGFQLCDEPPGRLQGMVGAEPVRGAPRPHGSIHGYEYWFTNDSGHRTLLQLGTSESSCASGFLLSAEADWR